MSNVVFRKLSVLAGAFACAGLLAACGGGGGSPGVSVHNLDPLAVKAASVAVVMPVTTMPLSYATPVFDSSGKDVTPTLTVTATVKDGNNQAVPGATVLFKTTVGSISNSGVTSDANGQVTERLSIEGLTGLQPQTKINVSAGVKDLPNVGSNTVEVTVQ